MAIDLNDNIAVKAPKPSDPRYLRPDNQVWSSVLEVNTTIPLTERYPGLPVRIGNVEYEYKDGILDSHLVLKNPSSIATPQNTLISIGEVVQIDNEYTFQSNGVTNYSWIINSILYANTTTVITINYAALGNKRRDMFYFDATNIIKHREGTEVLVSEQAITPELLPGEIFLSFIDVTDSTSGTTAPVYTEDFVRRSFLEPLDVEITNNYILANLAIGGQSNLYIQLGTGDIKGIAFNDTNLEVGRYPGKLLVLHNKTGNNLTLKHNDVTEPLAPCKFLFNNNTDLIFPTNQKIVFILSSDLNAEFLAKSWENLITQTSQLANNGSDGTSTYVETDELGATAFSNDYNDLDNRPNLVSLIREEIIYTTGSQTFTLNNNYSQVYSVEVQGQGALSASQYTLVTPNQITINDTLDSGDYIVVLYTTEPLSVTPYYTQGQVDSIVNAHIFNSSSAHPISAITSLQSELDAKVDKDFLELPLTGNILASTLEQNRVYVVTLGGSDRTITIDIPTNILFILNSANTLNFDGDVTPLNDDLSLSGIGNSMLIEYLSGANSLASKKGLTQINPEDYPLNLFPQPVTQRFLRDGIDRKADIVAGASFTTGNPRTFAVTFGTAFPDANYTITICGVDSRAWSYQAKGVGGFTINSNSGTALTGEVTWTAEKI